MRTRFLMATIALFLALAGQSAVAQTQQGQSDTASPQPATSKQAAATSHAATNSAASSSASAKAQAKPGIVLTNDNLSDAAAKKPAGSAADSQSDVKQAQTQNPRAQSQQGGQQGAATPKPKLQLPPHEVLTEENLPNLLDKRGVNVVGNGVDLSTIYDCDVNCYNQARQYANVYPAQDLKWMRELHDGIDKLQNDGKWRAHLVNLADLKTRYCKLAAEQASELYRVDNEQNVTDEQINIREEYNRKTAELGQEFQAEYARAGLLEGQYPPLTRGFMQVQEQRMTQMNCVSPNQNRYRYNSYPNDPNER
ncbi:MAG TPA: hypothetical protein VJN21_02855 [Candidatus Acidoferrales bacterium]|nr:hypothetical protein [Candidatus Acidoferrales bacterium]